MVGWAHLIFRWIKIETKASAKGLGSQEICQWTKRSWSLSDPSTRKIQEMGPHINKVYKWSRAQKNLISFVQEKLIKCQSLLCSELRNNFVGLKGVLSGT